MYSLQVAVGNDITHCLVVPMYAHMWKIYIHYKGFTHIAWSEVDLEHVSCRHVEFDPDGDVLEVFLQNSLITFDTQTVAFCLPVTFMGDQSMLEGTRAYTEDEDDYAAGWKLRLVVPDCIFVGETPHDVVGSETYEYDELIGRVCFNTPHGQVLVQMDMSDEGREHVYSQACERGLVPWRETQ